MLTGGVLLFCPPMMRAASPREVKPDVVAATCSVDTAEVEKNAPRPLRIRMNATDTQKHLLAYVWSGDGGVIEGVGPEITVNPTGLAVGTYRITGTVQDAYRNRAECAVEFRVTAPPEPLAAKCVSGQKEVESGKPATFEVAVTGALGGEQRIQWFANGGTIRGGTIAELDTSGMTPAEYTATARVEDGAGRATDCSSTVRVLAAVPPPPDPELINLGQVVFPRNVAFLSSADGAKLDDVVTRVAALGSGVISVEAYAGPDERDGQKLAGARGASVKQFLINKGVAEGMIRVRVGLGGRLGGVRNRTLDLVWVPDGFSY
jgi:outer membrane protein OmpA-like peptidoglycan-associated protein